MLLYTRYESTTTTRRIDEEDFETFLKFTFKLINHKSSLSLFYLKFYHI